MDTGREELSEGGRVGGHGEGVKGMRMDMSSNPPDGTWATCQSLHFHHHC